MIYSQVDSDGVFIHNSPDYTGKPFSAIEVALPSIPTGFLAQWVSSVEPWEATYGESTTGSWKVLEDHRKDTLYQTADGSSYTIGSEVQAGKYSGVDVIPTWLTKTPKPGQFYNWNSGAWVQDSEAQAENDKALERTWRDAQLNTVTWIRDRHRDQVEAGGATTITAEQFTELLAYIQALRDWPENANFPVVADRPVEAAWIIAQNTPQ